MKKYMGLFFFFQLLIFPLIYAMTPHSEVIPDDQSSEKKLFSSMEWQSTNQAIINRLENIFENPQLNELNRADKEKVIILQLKELFSTYNASRINIALGALPIDHKLSITELIQNNQELYISCFLQTKILYSEMITARTSNDFIGLGYIIIEDFPKLIKYCFSEEKDFFNVRFFASLFNPTKPVNKIGVHELFNHPLIKKNPLATPEQEATRKVFVERLLNNKNIERKTALDYATEHGQFYEVVPFLLGQGAKVIKSALDLAAQQKSVGALYQKAHTYEDDILNEQHKYLVMITALIKAANPLELKDLFITEATAMSPLEISLDNIYGSPEVDSLLIEQTHADKDIESAAILAITQLKNLLGIQLIDHPLSSIRRYLFALDKIFQRLTKPMINNISEHIDDLCSLLNQEHEITAIAMLCEKYSLLNLLSVLKEYNKDLWQKLSFKINWQDMWEKAIKDQEVLVIDFLIEKQLIDFNSFHFTLTPVFSTNNPQIIKKVFCYAQKQNAERAPQDIIDILDGNTSTIMQKWTTYNQQEKESLIKAAIISTHSKTFGALLTLYLPQDKDECSKSIQYRYNLMKLFLFCLECKNFKAALKVMIFHASLKTIQGATQFFTQFYLRQPNIFFNEFTKPYLDDFFYYFSSLKDIENYECCSICLEALSEQSFVSCTSAKPHSVHLDCYREQYQSKDIPDGCGICRSTVDTAHLYSTQECYQPIIRNDEQLNKLKAHLIQQPAFFNNKHFPTTLGIQKKKLKIRQLLWPKESPITISYYDNLILTWNKELDMFKKHKIDCTYKYLTSSPNGKVMLLGTDNSLYYKELSAFTPTALPSALTSHFRYKTVHGICISPSNKLFAFATECFIDIWSQDKQCFSHHILNNNRDSINNPNQENHNNSVLLSFSPDEKRIVCSGSGNIISFNIAQEKHTIAIKTGYKLPIQRFFAVTKENNIIHASENSIYMSDPSLLQPIHLYDHTTTVTQLVLSEDSSTLFSISDNNECQLWSLKKRTKVTSFFSIEKIQNVALSPDGSSFVIVNNNGKIICYDTINSSFLEKLSFDQIYFIDLMSKHPKYAINRNDYEKALFNSLPHHIQEVIKISRE